MDIRSRLSPARIGLHAPSRDCRYPRKAAVAGGKDANQSSAVQTIRQFYAAQNAGDTDGIVALMAEDVEYHDMVYTDPFRGKAEVAQYFVKVSSKHILITPRDMEYVAKAVPDYVKFVAEDVAGDERAVGVRWHVEIDGNIFPFSRGVSFYEINSDGKILRARDVVEGAVKPGTGALQAIGILAPLIRRLGARADPRYVASYSIWAMYAGYIYYVLLGSGAPGVPLPMTANGVLCYQGFLLPVVSSNVLHHEGQHVRGKQVSQHLQCSQMISKACSTTGTQAPAVLNFFYVEPALCAANISLLPCVSEHPVDEALFNFVNAYGLMLGGLMIADPQARTVPNKLPLWLGTMFLTNVFFIPFLALRAEASAAVPEEQEPMEAPHWLPAVGWLAALVGTVSVVWFIAARPEYGGIEQRWDYFTSSVQSKRIFFAFALDALLYSFFQAILMPRGAGKLRFVPFAGLALFLIGGAKGYSSKGSS